MSLTLWFFFDATLRMRARLVPADVALLEEEGGVRWMQGPVLSCAALSHALTLARPDETGCAETLVHRASEEEPWRAPERVSLSLLPRADAESAGLALDALDDLGLLSLFAEYGEALRAVTSALQAPLMEIVPDAGALCLRLARWPASDAASWLERLLLLWGAADWLARARGFRIAVARVRIGDAPWRDLTSAGRDALLGDLSLPAHVSSAHMFAPYPASER